MRAVAAIGALFLAGLVLAGVMLVRGTTLPWITSRLAAEASEVIGREVVLTEAPYLQLGDTLELRLRGLTVANAPWAGDEALLELSEGLAVLRLHSLFSDGPLEFDRIAIQGLQLRLVRDEEGRSNLPEALITDDTDATVEPAADASPEDGPEVPFIIDDLMARDIALTRENRATGTRQDLRIASLTQSVNGVGDLLVDGRGSLQNEAWSLTGTHSGLRSLLTGEQLRGDAEARLGDLKLTFDYRLADLNRLENLVLNARLTGSPPERIAAMSPLLSTDQSLLVEALISDVDPGIAVGVTIDLGETEMRISGSADDPGGGDGLELSIDADVPSLSRLAQALDLGSTEDLSLTIDGRVVRRGRRFEVNELRAQAGGHRIEGRILLPELPGTTDARIVLRASGPDFGFYQRLLQRPYAISAPYTADITLDGTSDQREALEADLRIGATRLQASGILGDFPSYRNTQLKLRASIEDLAIVGAGLGLTLPATALSIEGDVDVTQAGRVVLPGLLAKAAGIEATLSGELDTYPELDNVDLHLRAHTDSLGRSSKKLQGPALGPLPLTVNAAIHGSMRDLIVDDVSAAVGGSRLDTVGGKVAVAADGLHSDLHVAVEVDSLARMLAGSKAAGRSDPDAASAQTAEGRSDQADVAAEDPGTARPRVRDRPFSFELITAITPETVGLTLTRLDGLGIRGSVEWRSGADFMPDESMTLNADLTVDKPAELLPPIRGFTPPQDSLSLRAETSASTRRVSAVLSSATTDLLKAELLPRSARDPARLTLRGAGERLRSFGRIDAFPDAPLPYHIDASARIDDDNYRLEIRDLSVGDTQLTGSLRWQPARPSLEATINVVQADLAPWLEAAERATTGTAAGTKATDSVSRARRLIPTTHLPVAWLDGGGLDLKLTTGPLGIPDPQFPELSIVDGSDLRLIREDGKATLSVRELRGSRGNLELEAEAERTAEGARFSTNWQIDGLPIGILSEVLDPDDLPRHHVEAHFTGEGSTVRGLASTLSGDLLLTGEGGELEDLDLRLMTESFFQQLFSTLLPALKTDTPSLKVECTVIGLRAKNGIVALKPGLVIRSDRVDLSARGAVDLSTERLTVRFDNQARTGLGISAASLVNPYVQITGTLARPTIGLDITNSALAGGAAVATGGLTILAKPLFGRFLQRSSPCDIALERWRRDSAAADG